jgi:hypothetical protein
MTITNSLSPARAQAFHATMTAQHKTAGQVQFSLPPVADKTAPVGSSTPAPVASRGGVTQLPIASAPSDPGTSTAAQSIASVLSNSGSATPSHGNVASARLISRLYQGKS